jgi:hypothetical protein
MAPETQVERISVADARSATSAGRALLVCAYDDVRCARVRLEGAIPLSELERRAVSLPKSQELIFYCA